MPSAVRFDPFREITTLRDEMNRLVRRTAAGPAAASWTPAVDIIDRGDAIVLRAELPGLAVEDIDIQVHDDVLTVSGERRFEEVDEGHYHRVERAYGRFARSVGLPRNVAPDAITASFDRGLLEVRVPKAHEVQPRKIAVSAGAAA